MLTGIRTGKRKRRKADGGGGGGEKAEGLKSAAAKSPAPAAPEAAAATTSAALGASSLRAARPGDEEATYTDGSNVVGVAARAAGDASRDPPREEPARLVEPLSSSTVPRRRAFPPGGPSPRLGELDRADTGCEELPSTQDCRAFGGDALPRGDVPLDDIAGGACGGASARRRQCRCVLTSRGPASTNGHKKVTLALRGRSEI